MDLTLSSIASQLLQAHSSPPPTSATSATATQALPTTTTSRRAATPATMPHSPPSQPSRPLPPPLMVDILDAEASPPRPNPQSHHVVKRVKAFDERPNTPLDFFHSSKININNNSRPPPPPPKETFPVLTSTGTESGKSYPSTAATRTSMDQGKPAVDPAIKGIPPGWDDDPNMPLHPAPGALQSQPIHSHPPSQSSSKPDLHPHPHPQPRPQPHPQPRPQPRSQPLDALDQPRRQESERPSSPPSNRLAKQKPFNDTRVKLSSFSGMVKEGWRDRDGSRGYAKETKGGSQLKVQAHLGPPTDHHAHLHQTAHSLRTSHVPSKSVHSDSSFITHSTTKTASTSPSASVMGPGMGNSAFHLAPASSTGYTETETGTAETGETSASADSINLITPSPTAPTTMTSHPYPTSDPGSASVKSETSKHSRDGVMGRRHDPILPAAAQSKVFLTPQVSDVLPFAAGRPFVAWSVPTEEDSQASSQSHSQHSSDKAPGRSANTTSARRPSLPLSSYVVAEDGPKHEGWKESARRGGEPGKRVWMEGGEEVGGVYKVGWEREVLDLEGRLHETMYEVAGDKHTFTDFPEPPKAVLDIGTGLGLWPISQALIWPDTTFVGLDLVPCQVDLGLLADAERMARSTSTGTASGMGIWESVEGRITWQKADFLSELPFDTGVFDLVHIRFIGLGVPENKWADLLEEATRVLKRGGKLEVIDTSYTLPTSVPISLQNSFASLLLADMINALPVLPVRFSLQSSESVVSAEASKPRFEKSWKRSLHAQRERGQRDGGRGGREGVSGALEDALMVWVRSALEYKSTGLVKGGKGSRSSRVAVESMAKRVQRELAQADQSRWNDDEAGADEGLEDVEGEAKENRETRDEGEVSVWAWVVSKK